MADSILVLSPLVRVTDDNGDPVPGAKLKFFEAGTTTPLTVYSDSDLSISLTSVVTCDDGGYPVSSGDTKTLIWTGDDTYKVVVTDADDVVLATHDDLKGALVIPSTVVSALPKTPVIARTTTLVISSSYETYRGRLINANPTGGSFSITLPSAVTAGDGYRIGIRHAAAANTVTIRTSGDQLIGGIGQSSLTSFSLTGLGHCVWLVSDGAGWVVDTHVPPLMVGGLAYFKVTDRLTGPPVSPVGGARYIINGTPTGAWLSAGFSAKDIVEYDGTSGWIKYAPTDGYAAWIDDEDRLSIYYGSAWTDQTGMEAAQASTLGYAVFEYQALSSTDGGGATTGAWTTRPLNLAVVNTMPGASLSSNAITLPVGKYLILAQQSFYSQEDFSTSVGGRFYAQQRINAGTATLSASTLIGLSGTVGTTLSVGSATGNADATFVASDMFIVSVTVAGTINLQYVTNNGQDDALGVASPDGSPEIYARVVVISLDSLQGPQGEQGLQGIQGAQGIQGPAAPVQISGNSNGQVTAGSTVYISQGVADATYADAAGVITDDGSITKLRLSVGTAPGSGQSLTATLYKNGATTDLTGTISGTSTTLSATDDIAFAAGDTWAIQVVASAAAASSGGIAFGLTFEAD